MSGFVICLDNESNPASLIVGKIYQSLPDPEAEAHTMLRVLDEDRSEPDGYLYPGRMFAPIDARSGGARADGGGRAKKRRCLNPGWAGTGPLQESRGNCAQNEIGAESLPIGLHQDRNAGKLNRATL